MIAVMLAFEVTFRPANLLLYGDRLCHHAVLVSEPVVVVVVFRHVRAAEYIIGFCGVRVICGGQCRNNVSSF